MSSKGDKEMLLSEMIAGLEALKKEHGDLVVKGFDLEFKEDRDIHALGVVNRNKENFTRLVLVK
ncbi:MAG: hypothetical protein ACRDCB_06015 [Clostridium sp.]|uniref:hypothetical protein n=1 Tax=Clostridium sp. TaxID=1506 RepID=UPI003EE5EB1E